MFWPLRSCAVVCLCVNLFKGPTQQPPPPPHQYTINHMVDLLSIFYEIWFHTEKTYARNYIIKFLFCSSISFSDACIKVNIIWIFRWTINAYLFGFTLAPVALWLALGRLLQNLPDIFDLTPLLVSVRHPGISTDPLSHQRHKGTIRKDMESEFWNSININSLNLITWYILICQIIVPFKCNDIFVLKLYTQLL